MQAGKVGGSSSVTSPAPKKAQNEYTDDELHKAAITAGLDLYGLPNPASGDHKEFYTLAKRLGIDTSKYKYSAGTGLIYSINGESGQGITRQKISDRIKETGELSCDDQCEYVFKPSSNKGLDVPFDENLFSERLRDTNGRIYTAGGWGVNEYKMDITESQAKKLVGDE
jgi:hypothetical protein